MEQHVLARQAVVYASRVRDVLGDVVKEGLLVKLQSHLSGPSQ